MKLQSVHVFWYAVYTRYRYSTVSRVNTINIIISCLAQCPCVSIAHSTPQVAVWLHLLLFRSVRADHCCTIPLYIICPSTWSSSPTCSVPDTNQYLVPRTRTITYGPRSFAVSGPCVWNDLPPTLRVSPGTLRQFQGALKTIVLSLIHI